MFLSGPHTSIIINNNNINARNVRAYVFGIYYIYIRYMLTYKLHARAQSRSVKWSDGDDEKSENGNGPSGMRADGR